MKISTYDKKNYRILVLRNAKEKIMKNRLFFIWGMLLILVGCQTASLRPEEVVNQYYAYQNVDDIEKLNCLLLNPEVFDFKAIKEFNIVETTVQSETEDSVEVIAKVEVIHEKGKMTAYNEGINYRIFKLKKIRGEWKIKEIGLC